MRINYDSINLSNASIQHHITTECSALKIEHKFLSNETAEALRTIRKILEKFPEYGVVDLLALYSPKDVILSIVALSRLQNIVFNQQTDKDTTIHDGGDPIDEQTLNDLAHYAKFAHAAYGWKGLAAFCGRLHFGGDSRALVKRCGIRRRDILMASWHSRANRPVSSVHCSGHFQLHLNMNGC